MRQFSDKQLIRLLERRSPHHPRHIGYDLMRAFLEGRIQLPAPLGDQLPADHYRVTTTGVLPAWQELDGGSRFDRASELFGRKYTWQIHESNVEEDLTPGERIFHVKHFGVRFTSEAATYWAKEHGYRDATHTEAIDFAASYPELQRKYSIVALGSFAVRGERGVALLYEDEGERSLANGWYGQEWRPDYRFLLVRTAA